jgi:hypothetical protein
MFSKDILGDGVLPLNGFLFNHKEHSQPTPRGYGGQEEHKDQLLDAYTYNFIFFDRVSDSFASAWGNSRILRIGFFLCEKQVSSIKFRLA